jgi:hypothetical protein
VFKYRQQQSHQQIVSHPPISKWHLWRAAFAGKNSQNSQNRMPFAAVPNHSFDSQFRTECSFSKEDVSTRARGNRLILLNSAHEIRVTERLQPAPSQHESCCPLNFIIVCLFVLLQASWFTYVSFVYKYPWSFVLPAIASVHGI